MSKVYKAKVLGITPTCTINEGQYDYLADALNNERADAAIPSVLAIYDIATKAHYTFPIRNLLWVGIEETTNVNNLKVGL